MKTPSFWQCVWALSLCVGFLGANWNAWMGDFHKATFGLVYCCFLYLIRDRVNV